MPLPTATGELTGAVNNLANQIANCAAFRTFTGTANAAQALERVHYSALPKPAHGGVHSLAELKGHRPFALIYNDEETGITLTHDSSGVVMNHVPQEIALHFYLERDVPPEHSHNPSQADADFVGIVDDFLSDFLALAGVAGYFGVSELTLRGPVRSTEEDEPAMGDYQVMFFRAVHRIGA
jgi:hypothetical protein